MVQILIEYFLKNTKIGSEWISLETMKEFQSLLGSIGASNLHNTEIRETDGMIVMEHSLHDYEVENITGRAGFKPVVEKSR